MRSTAEVRTIVFLTAATLVLSACDNRGTLPPPGERSSPAPAPAKSTPAEHTPPAAPPSASATADPGHSDTSESAKPVHPPITQPAGAASTTLKLDGLTMTIPEGWTAQAGKPGPMAPKAVFRLLRADGDAADAAVRVTHFPAMKGMDEANITRWVGQVKRPDGTPSTRADARVSTVELGAVRLTIVDVGGMVKTDMPAPHGAGLTGQRMIAAIVDHPKGPHFVKALGPVATIDKWKEAIHAFLRSAKLD